MNIEECNLVLRMMTGEIFQEHYAYCEAIKRDNLSFVLFQTCERKVREGVEVSHEESYFSPVYRDQISYTQKQKELLFQRALQNSFRLMPPRLLGEVDLGSVDLLQEGKFMEETLAESKRLKALLRQDENGFRLTTTSWQGGAIAAFYPGVLEQLRFMFQGDFYLTFPTPHVTRIHPVRTNNCKEVARALAHFRREYYYEELLSPYVYRYCGQQMGISRVI